MATDVQPAPAVLPRLPRIRPPLALLTLLGALLIWQAATMLLHIPAYLLPPPTAIAASLVSHWQIMAANAWVTTLEVVFGFAISVLLGVPLAVLITYSAALDRALYPLIVGSQTIPKVAIAPLLLAWLGFGLAPKMAIVVLIAFFPIVINAVVGLRAASPQMLYLAQSMGATSWQIFWRFRLPHALPNMFAGLKMATVLSVTGAVVGEFVGADSGLGYVIMVAGSNFQIDLQFAAIILLCVIGVVFFGLLGWAERRLLPWHVSIRGSDL